MWTECQQYNPASDVCFRCNSGNDGVDLCEEGEQSLSVWASNVVQESRVERDEQ